MKIVSYENRAAYFEKQVGRKWEIDEAIYNDFLDMLPPLGWRGDAFFMREFTFGDITSKFTREGDRYFFEVAHYPERPVQEKTVAADIAPGCMPQ